MNKIEVVETLIERYESQIEELQNKVYDLEEKLDSAEEWANIKAFYRPRDLDGDDLDLVKDLPVPRLQIELTIHSEHHHSWFYSLVYRHLCDDLAGKLTMIPLGMTESKGGHKYDRYDSLEEMQRSLPFRDRAYIKHDAAHLGIPAFAVANGWVWELPPRETR